MIKNFLAKHTFRTTILNSLRSPFTILCLIGSALAFYAPAQEPAMIPANSATAPTDRMNEPWWATRHQAVVSAAQTHPDAELLLVGDSIIQNYEKARIPDENFQPTWREFYEPRKALNLGFSGDATANVLWRLDHGELQGLHPKAVLLLIGTNNTGWKDQTAE